MYTVPKTPPPYCASSTRPLLNEGVNEPYLLKACRQGSLEGVHYCANNMSVRLDTPYRCGETGDQVTGLFLAAKGGHTNVCWFLNEKNASVTDTEFLHLCAIEGSSGLLRCVRPRCEPDLLNQGLIDAINKGHRNNIDTLLQMGAAADGRGATSPHLPLEEAILQNEQEIAVQLITCGADVNATTCDLQEKTLLDVAVCHNRPEMVSLLMKHGANPGAPSLAKNRMTVGSMSSNEMGRTIDFYDPDINILSRAIDLGHEAVVDAMLDSGKCSDETLTEPNKRVVRSGVSTLTGAQFRQATDDAVRQTVSSTVVLMSTPLNMAVFTGRENIVRRLLQERAVVRTIDSFKTKQVISWRQTCALTPLGTAARFGYRDIVEALLAQGANAAYKGTNSIGFIHYDDPPSPATLARKARHEAIATRIEKAKGEQQRAAQRREQREAQREAQVQTNPST